MALRPLRSQGMDWGPGETVTTREYVVEEEEGRLDVFLVSMAPGLTRSQIRRLTGEGCVLLNGGVPKVGQKLRSGDRISITVPPPRPVELAPEVIPLNIVYQDGELLVVDKPAGLTVHPAPGHPSHTLVNALLGLCPDLQGIGGEPRPGIVHRLDKDTSGLMVVAKSSRAHLGISKQMKDRTVRKGYLALAWGRLEPAEGRIDAPVGRDPRNRKRMAVVAGGREARTGYKVQRYLNGLSLVELSPETGRTHQLRVHLASAGHPLVGDSLYGNKRPPALPSLPQEPALDRHFLHAHFLGFQHPTTGEYVEFSSPLPEELQTVLRLLGLGP